MNRRFGLLFVAGIVLWTAGCGSSNNGSTVTGVTATCLPSTIQSAQLLQCTSTVTGTATFSTSVTWMATAGSINTAGIFTAPVVSAPTLVTITATSTQNTDQSGTATVTINPVNLQSITVDAGPQPQTFTAVDEAFVSVTVCVPNTNTCQTIDHILVDTGSSGLRLLSSLLTISLPQQNDSSGNPLDECIVIADGYVWGPVALADISIAGEKAPSAPVQVMIPGASSPTVPGTCSSRTTGPNEGNSVAALGANGVLGVGLFQKDCGTACTTANGTIPPVYYDCPSSGCNPTYVTLAQQVPNPVTMFSLDNNGVMIFLPSVPAGGLTTVNGSLIFGVGTQSNNTLQSATVYTVPDSGANAGDIMTTFNGVSYPASITSGSTGILFLDNATTGIPTCTVRNSTWYCPATSPDNLSATNQGTNGNQGVVNFSIENANTLLNSSNTAFSTLGGPQMGGPQTGSFDWGLAFFFGKNVFTAIENMNTPAGTGPYYAY
jgi:Protein of unknown function (DUF3443)